MEKKINWPEELLRAWKTLLRGAGLIVKVVADVLITLLLIVSLAGVIVGCALTIYIKNYVNTEIDVSLFRMTMAGGTTATTVYYYDFEDRVNRVGEVKALEGEKISADKETVYVKLDQIPDDLKYAVIAIEDKRFETHQGVDWKRTFGAALTFLTGSSSFGGSSITQQLIKNITGEDDYTIQRKIQEIFWALDLETKMDKDEILELYLNKVNFGGSNYGVQSAAYNYFSKDVSELTLLECAAIAGITQNPSYYNPINYPEHNEERRGWILYEMLDQGRISRRRYDEAMNSELVIKTPSENEKLTEQQASGIISWGTEYVISEIVSDLVSEKGMTVSDAEKLVYSGGLKIYTTIVPEIQQLLDDVFSNEDNFPDKDAGYKAQSAGIVMDPYTGDILGVAGARGQKTGNRLWNYAWHTKRPSGSAIKPLSVYAPALDSGSYTWASVLDDTPVNYTVSFDGWPRNSETFDGGNRYLGLTNIYNAVRLSLNTIPVKLLNRTGLRRAFNFCYDTLNMKSLIEYSELADGTVVSDIGQAALGLGQLTYGVKIAELTAAYSIFPNDGVYNDYHAYLKVTDNAGNVILSHDVESTLAIKAETAEIMNKMLSRVISAPGGTAYGTPGTESGVQFGNITGIDVAGKTGSAGDYYDRWFVGYTPYYLCGLWFGYPQQKAWKDANPTLRLFDKIMLPLHEEYAALPDEQREHFTDSDQIVTATYCKDSGLLITDACLLDPRGSRAETGYFIRGTEPTEKCDTHVVFNYDSVTGGLCHPGCNCPEENITRVSLVRVNKSDRLFDANKYLPILDAQYTWFDLTPGVKPYSSHKSWPYYTNMRFVAGTDPKTGTAKTIVLTLPYTSSYRDSQHVQFNATCNDHFDADLWASLSAAYVASVSPMSDILSSRSLSDSASSVSLERIGLLFRAKPLSIAAN